MTWRLRRRWQGTVRQLLHKRIRETYIHPQFISDVIRPMLIEQLFDQMVQVSRTPTYNTVIR